MGRIFVVLAGLTGLALALYVGAAVGIYDPEPWMGWVLVGVAAIIYAVRLSWLSSDDSEQ